MLVEFSVKNFLSIKDMATLSMAAAAIHEHEESNTQRVGNLILLKSAALYGANASGKSNLIKAFRFVKNFILTSSKGTNIADRIAVEPFMLNTETENEPSFFETIFYVGEKRFRYNFEVNGQFVVSENLYFVPNKTEALLFERKGDDIKTGNYFKEGKKIRELTRKNALFLSVAAQFNGEISKSVLEWFENCHILSGLYDAESMNYTKELLKNDEFKKKIISFIRSSDISVENIELEEETEAEKSSYQNMVWEKMKYYNSFRVVSVHKKYGTENKEKAFTQFDFSKSESDGTNKLLALAGLILSAKEKQKVLIIDEFDARLHPLLSIQLIRQFNSSEANRMASQLIITSHDLKLMSANLFRRDQIWFTDKNSFEETRLYSLVEFKGVRNDTVIEKNYFDGRYGAIPYLSEISTEFLS